MHQTAFEEWSVSRLNLNLVNRMRNTLKEIATSFYTFSKTGIFTPAIKDIASLSMDDAYQCQRMLKHSASKMETNRLVIKWGTSAAIRKQFGFDEPIYGQLADAWTI